MTRNKQEEEKHQDEDVEEEEMKCGGRGGVGDEENL